MTMHLVKALAVGAAAYGIANWAGSQSFVTSASPTIAKYAPYLICGGVLMAAKHFGVGV
jgi:hypothetical protein